MRLFGECGRLPENQKVSLKILRRFIMMKKMLKTWYHEVMLILYSIEHFKGANP